FSRNSIRIARSVPVFVVMAYSGDKVTKTRHRGDEVRAIDWVILNNRPLLGRQLVLLGYDRRVFLVDFADVVEQRCATNFVDSVFRQPDRPSDCHGKLSNAARVAGRVGITRLDRLNHEFEELFVGLLKLKVCLMELPEAQDWNPQRRSGDCTE